MFYHDITLSSPYLGVKKIDTPYSSTLFFTISKKGTSKPIILRKTLNQKGIYEKALYHRNVINKLSCRIGQ